MIRMNRTLAAVVAVVFMTAALVLSGGRFIEASDQKEPAPREKKRDFALAQEGGSTEPKGLPLEARLIAKENSYTLDLDGDTPEQFRKVLEEARSKGGPLPIPPAVNLVLELRNTGKTDLYLCVGKGDVGPVNGLTLDLKGPGVLNASIMNVRGASIQPHVVKIAAGKTHTIPMTKLEFYDGRTTQASYWTKPGEYKLAVSCGVVEGGEKGFWRAAGKIVSAPIKLKVGLPKAKASEPAKAGDLTATAHPTADHLLLKDRFEQR